MFGNGFDSHQVHSQHMLLYQVSPRSTDTVKNIIETKLFQRVSIYHMCTMVDRCLKNVGLSAVIQVPC